MQHKFTFGPVNSRRLGLSLGVDIVPGKFCTLDCIYCEAGKTTTRTTTRQEFFNVEEIISEIDRAISEYPDIEHITISGSGEPTLNRNMGKIISEIKKHINIPVAVLTNGTLLNDPDVRADLLEADIVIPSLDAVTQETFKKVNRPSPDLQIDSIIEGLKLFRKQYKGALWLEILFVEGINDNDDELLKMKEIIEQINPDKVHINTVVRPPACAIARPVSEQRLIEIQKILGDKSEIIGGVTSKHKDGHETNSQSILELLKRRPMTLNDIAISLGVDSADLEATLNKMLSDRVIKTYLFEGKEFYQAI